MKISVDYKIATKVKIKISLSYAKQSDSYKTYLKLKIGQNDHKWLLILVWWSLGLKVTNVNQGMGIVCPLKYK